MGAEVPLGARRRAALNSHIQQFVVQPYDGALCLRWAEVMVSAERRGRAMSHADAWQAATALQLAVPLVSHNRRDFASVAGLVLISEAPA